MRDTVPAALRLVDARDTPEDLAAIATGALQTGALCFVLENTSVYWLDKESDVEVSPPAVVAAYYGASAPGRWFQQFAVESPAISNVVYVSAATRMPEALQDGSALLPFRAIEPALELATALGGATIQISAGEYELASASQHAVPANTTIRGAGIGKTVIRLAVPYATQAYGFRCTGVDNVLFTGFTVDGRAAEQPYGPGDNGQIAIGITDGSSNVRVDGVECVNMSKDGVYVRESADTLVANSVVRNFSRGGVVTVGCEGLVVRDNLFEDGEDLPTVIGNAGFWLEPNDALVVFRNIRVYGNTFRRLLRGVLLVNSTEVENSLVEHDNTYTDCKEGGICCRYMAKATFSRSTFERCGTVTGAGLPVAAVSILGSDNCELDHAVFRDCSGGTLTPATVVVSENSRNALVRWNRFYDDRKSAVFLDAVVGGNSRRYVTDNVCIGGSQASPGTSAAFRVIGTALNPVDSDVLEDNIVEIGPSSYEQALQSDYFSGGRTSPNHVIGTGRAMTFTNGSPGVVVAGQTYAIRHEDRIVDSNPGTNVARAYTLPERPAPGQRHLIKDAKGDAATRNITITPFTGTIDGSPNLVISTNYGRAEVYFGTTEWHVG